MSVRVIVLAAGKGTRMKTDRAKVLHEAAGRTLLEWAMSELEALDVVETAVVVGHQAEDVAKHCPEGVAVAVQDPQHGTGHAASVGLTGLSAIEGPVLILPGDMPLIRPSSLAALVAAHEEAGAAASILSVHLDDPHGYGRIVRSGGDVIAIVEERDASPEQKQIAEINTSVYVFDGPVLADALGRIGTDNDQGEYYLTDVVEVLVEDGRRVIAVSVDPEEGTGVNSQRQLADVARALRRRINDRLLDSGVWMLDPDRTYVDATATVEPGAMLHPETHLRGATSVAAGAEVGPNAHLTDTVVAAGARVLQAVATSATIGEGASVGPFAYLRPGAVLGRGAKVGTYVEVKGSVIGDGSKVPHLSYIGDATIGTSTNVGAGTITVNYDGYAKHRTVIGDRVRIGSDTMLVAPVTVGDDAFTGAGSVVTADVPPGALAVERSPQRNVEGYAEKRRRRAEGDDA
jgi:bifunctional UDP-N-acetylglucosamine pyrophosphorylase/glucosamine-1-phosphate N-acetyltransferase